MQRFEGGQHGVVVGPGRVQSGGGTPVPSWDTVTASTHSRLRWRREQESQSRLGSYSLVGWLVKQFAVILAELERMRHMGYSRELSGVNLSGVLARG